MALVSPKECDRDSDSRLIKVITTGTTTMITTRDPITTSGRILTKAVFVERNARFVDSTRYQFSEPGIELFYCFG